MVEARAVEEESRLFAEELAESREQALAAITTADESYLDPEEHIAAGTGGFRSHHSKFKRVAFRLGLLVGMRAKSLGHCGIMITASHNQHEDNGIKIFEPDGKILGAEWELLAEMLVNSVDLIWSMKNLNELTLKGFPTQTNLFSVQAIPSPLPTAQTLEEMKETEGYVHEPEFPHVFIAHDSR